MKIDQKYVYLVCASYLVVTISFAEANQVTYHAPKVGGYALDLCKEWGTNCGKPAAIAYCISKGHKTALSYTIRKDSPPTKVINGGGICVESYCDRISKVTCMTRTYTYNAPKVGNYALDLCREWGANCGKPAANAYCISKGHKTALSYVIKKDSPPTKVINGGGICVEPYCDKISKVVCK